MRVAQHKLACCANTRRKIGKTGLHCALRRTSCALRQRQKVKLPGANALRVAPEQA
ncbi:hypothetical protein A2U01_0098462, partial [Trifolium medium]|nr:hypothetical protein [Trifolium medium]